MTAPEVPSWLVPGAQVVLYSTGGISTPPNVVVTKIDRVAKLSFTVVAEDGRFPIKWLSHRHGGSTRHVVPADSPEGQAEIAAARSRRKVRLAETACEKWSRSHHADDLQAAIAALRAVQADGAPQ